MSAWRSFIQSRAWTQRRVNFEGISRRRKPPESELQLGPTQRAFPEERSHPNGYDSPLRGPHRGIFALRSVREPFILVLIVQFGGPHSGRHLRSGTDGGVPQKPRPHRSGGAGPADPFGVRQCVLPRPGVGKRATELGPGAVLGRRVAAHGGSVREQRGGLQRSVCGGHQEAGKGRSEDWERWGDKERLHDLQFMNAGFIDDVFLWKLKT